MLWRSLFLPFLLPNMAAQLAIRSRTMIPFFDLPSSPLNLIPPSQELFLETDTEN